MKLPQMITAMSWMEAREEFSEEEAARLLDASAAGVMSEDMADKLRRVGLSAELFPRNLEVLLRVRG